MALSKEYTIYCLSKSKGWIRTEVKYDSGRIEDIAIRPSDTLLEIKFITEITYPSKIYKEENIIYITDKSEELEVVKKKYGERPDNPYI